MRKIFSAAAFLGAATVLVVGFVLNPFASAAVPGVNDLVSVDSSENQSNSGSQVASISGDGRYVAFESYATNLVSGDTNGYIDVFVRDRTSGTTERVSVSSSGAQATGGHSTKPRISYDGRYVAFESASNDLVSGDSGHNDVFVRDRQAGTTSLASITSGGTKGSNNSYDPDISADGRFVVFETVAWNLTDGMNGTGAQIAIKDMATGATKAISVGTSGTTLGNSTASEPRISCDGGVVAYQSGATNLVSGDTNGTTDVFVAVLGWSGFRTVDATILGNAGSASPDVSCDGNFVAFSSNATNLVGSDTNGLRDIFKYNRITGETVLASLTDADAQVGSNSEAEASISDDGRYVTFSADASGVDTYTGNYSGGNIFVRDTRSGTTQAVSRNANYVVGQSTSPVISDDGSFITYLNTEVSGGAYGKLLTSDANGTQDIYVSETGF